MASHAHIGDWSARAIKFEVQWCFIRAINDDDIEIRCRLLASPLTATNNELLTIAESLYAVEHGAQHMSVGGSKSVNANHTSNQKWEHQKKTTSNNQCGNCTKHHATGHANCPGQDCECNKCGHIGHWKSKCRGGAPPPKQNGKIQHQRKAKCIMGRRDILTSLRWKNLMANMMKLMYTFLGLTLIWLVI